MLRRVLLILIHLINIPGSAFVLVKFNQTDSLILFGIPVAWPGYINLRQPKTKLQQQYPGKHKQRNNCREKYPRSKSPENTPSTESWMILPNPLSAFRRKTPGRFFPQRIQFFDTGKTNHIQIRAFCATLSVISEVFIRAFGNFSGLICYATGRSQ